MEKLCHANRLVWCLQNNFSHCSLIAGVLISLISLIIYVCYFIMGLCSFMFFFQLIMTVKLL